MPAMVGSIKEEDCHLANLGKKRDPIFKITRAKRAWDLAQEVEHPPSKHESLSSNPNVGGGGILIVADRAGKHICNSPLQ
jgi:hypothetical protein